MKEPTALQLLWENNLCYEHILQQIFLYLDSSSVRNLKLSSMEMRNFVQRVLWQNKRSNRCLHYRLKNRWAKALMLVVATLILFLPVHGKKCVVTFIWNESGWWKLLERPSFGGKKCIHVSLPRCPQSFSIDFWSFQCILQSVVSI